MSGLAALIANLAGNGDLGQSEIATRMWAVHPILEALGWRLHAPDEFVPKHPAAGGSPYYCLRGGGRTLALIEARRAGADLAGERQRIPSSSAEEGAPLAALTDGLTWLFYLPERMDPDDPQPFFRVDCRGQDPARAAAGLERFLGREASLGGSALAAARDEAGRRERERAALDAAWEHMLGDPDGLVRDLLAETAREAGAEPDRETLSDFLRAKREGDARRQPRRDARRGRRPASKQAEGPAPEALDTSDPAVFKGRRPSAFRLGGRRHAIGSWRELLPAVCGLLAGDDPAAFVERTSRLRGQPHFRDRSQFSDADDWIEIGGTRRYVYVDITADHAVERARRVVEAVRGRREAASFLVEAERTPMARAKPRRTTHPQRGTSYGGKKPAAYWLDGVRHEATRWHEVLSGVSNRMALEAGSAFGERVAELRGAVRPYFSEDPSRLHHPLRLEHSNLYADGKFSANDSVRLARRVIEAVRGPQGADSFRIELAE